MIVARLQQCGADAVWPAHVKERTAKQGRLVHNHRSSVRFGDPANDSKSEARALAAWLRGEECFANSLAKFEWNPGAAVMDAQGEKAFFDDGFHVDAFGARRIICIWRIWRIWRV